MAAIARYAERVEISRNPTETPQVKKALWFQKIPEKESPEWEIWVNAIDTIRGYNENTQYLFAGQLFHIVCASRPDQLDELPDPLKTIFKKAQTGALWHQLQQ